MLLYRIWIFCVFFVAHSEIATNVCKIIGCWFPSKRNCSRHSHKHTPFPCNWSLVLFCNVFFGCCVLFPLFFFPFSHSHSFWLPFSLSLLSVCMPFSRQWICLWVRVHADDGFPHLSAFVDMNNMQTLSANWGACAENSCAPLHVICGISCTIRTRNDYFNGNRWAFSYVFYSDDCVHYSRNASFIYMRS